MKILLSIVIFIIFFSFFNTPVNAACGASTYCSVSGGACTTSTDTTCGIVASGACIGFAGGSSCIGNYCYSGSHYQTVCDANCCGTSGSPPTACQKLGEWDYCDDGKVPGSINTSAGCTLPPTVTRVGDSVTVDWGCAYEWGHWTAANNAVLYHGLALYKITLQDIQDAYNNNNYDYVSDQFLGIAPDNSSSFTFTDSSLSSFPVFIVPNCMVSSNITPDGLRYMPEGGGSCFVPTSAPPYPDTTPPTCTDPTYSPSSVVNGTITGTSTASDANGIARTGVYIYQGNTAIKTIQDNTTANSATSFSKSWDLMNSSLPPVRVPDGTYQMHFNWYDPAGNMKQCKSDLTVTTPPTDPAPTCTLTPTTASVITGGTINPALTLKAVDNDTSVKYAVSTSGGTVTPTPTTPLPTITANGTVTKPIGFTALSIAGSPTVTVTVTDSNGQIGSCATLVTVTAPPLVPDYSLELSKSGIILDKGGNANTATARLRDVTGATDWTNNVALACTVTDKTGVSAGTKPTCSLSPTTKVPSTSPDTSGDSTLTVITGTATGDFWVKVEGESTQGTQVDLKRSASLILTVRVPNTAPACSLSLSGTTITGQPANVFELDSNVTVTATASDANGDPISYSWSITDTLDGTLTPSVTNVATYKTPVSFNKTDSVQLQVSDGTLTSTCTTDIKSEDSYILSGKVYKALSAPSQSDADICSAITNVPSQPGASGITLSDKKYTFSNTSANTAGNYNNLKLSVRDGKVKLCLNLSDPAYIDLQIVDSCAIASGNLEFSKITGSTNCIEVTSTAGALTTGNVGTLNIPLKLVPNPYFVVFDGDVFSAEDTILNRPSSTNFNPANNYERFISKYNDHSTSAKSGVLISQGTITTQWDNNKVDFTSKKGVANYSGLSGKTSTQFMSTDNGVFARIKGLSNLGKLTGNVVYKDSDLTIDNTNYASYQQKIIYVKGNVTINSESIPIGQVLNVYVIATGEISVPQISCPKCRNTLTINGGLVANVGSNGSATAVLSRSIVPNNASDDFYKKPSIILQLNPSLYIDSAYDQAKVTEDVYKEIL